MVATEVPTGAAAARLRALLPALSDAEARVARCALEQPDEIVRSSVSEVAAMADVSPATVVRCCQRIGYRGFQDLKLALARDTASWQKLPRVQIGDRDSAAAVLDKVFLSSAAALSDARTIIDREAFEAATIVLDRARSILFAGVGTSAPLAQDAAYRFSTLGLAATSPPDIHAQHVAARLLGPKDACVTVSHTGSTRETVAVTTSAHDAGATTIAVTSFGESPLTGVADLVLVAGGPELSFRLEAMSSRIAHLTLLDPLYVALAQRRRSRAERALDLTAEVLAEHRY
jgi:RpiR family carbohydrate utilization transcriptional regulator